MTELIHERSRFFLYGVDDRLLINILLLYSLTVTAFGVLLISGVLTSSLKTHINTVQPVTRNIIDYQPVEVKMPTLPMGPSWNGSSGNDIPQHVEISELLYTVNRH